MHPIMRITLSAALVLISAAGCRGDGNLLDDPSFEITKSKDQFGLVFARWGGWKYEGDCEFRVGEVAHSGTHSCLLKGGIGAKIRVAQNVALGPGKYRVTAYLRGLDIGKGAYNWTTEFMFDGKYQQLNKNGTFGWTKLTYVGAVTEAKQTGPSFGLMAPGYFWIDDVTLEKVGDDVPLTDAPVLADEEAPIAPAGALSRSPVRCGECGYRNNPAGKICYACGAPLSAASVTVAGPQVRPIATFEERNPVSGGTVVGVHASQGRRRCAFDAGYASIDQPQSWLGYDFLKADLYTEARKPLDLYVEVRDEGTRDYWTRVNYSTVAPPGKSTLIIPIKQLYVGEKSRPGRMLDLARITRLVFGIGDAPEAPLYLDNLRLERDDSPFRVRFEGLHAFDLGTNTSPVMEGFTPITPSTLYSKGRGYGLKDAKIGAPTTPFSLSLSTRISSASSRADWLSTCPRAVTMSSSTSTARRASGASTRPIASGQSWPRAGRWSVRRLISRPFAKSTSGSGTWKTAPPTARSTSTRKRISTRSSSMLT